MGTIFSRGIRSAFYFFKSFAADERAQATVEYILLLSVVVAGAIAFSRRILGVLDKAILSVGGQLEKDLKTGRAPLGVWRN
jgi:hypothetical protein